MKNPLNKRLPRELKSELGKYLVIVILLVSTIGLVSGFLVADTSMLLAYNEGFAKYNVEDGHFRVEKALNKAQQKTITEAGVTLYDLPYREAALANGTTLRLYADRTQVNKICLMQGALPAAADEAAIDRMYADNNGLSVGDTVTDAAGNTLRITGLVALPDYSCLFSDNNDTMFDAVQFGVGIVTPQGFAALPQELNYVYAWKYNSAPADTPEEKSAAEDLLQVVNGEASLLDYVPRYQNQAITFTGEDMGSDRAMMVVLLYIIIAIMAFVFAVTTGNTIAKEANVIGTLRASGYTCGELVRHYMAMPVLVTLLSAGAGNLLGYTVLKDVCAGMYYGSYSLPTYVTRWNANAFWMTTAVPVALMIAINWAVLRWKLTLPPLQFLRRDLRRRTQKHALPLSKHIPFFSRFRLRVLLQNLGSYAVLLVGVLFANLLLGFGLMLPDALTHYQQSVTEDMLANCQTLLQIPYSAMNEDRKLQSLVSMMLFRLETQTDEESAEPFSVYSLQTLAPEEGGAAKTEAVLLYGVEPDSRYVALPGDDVYISSAYADKFQLKAGDTITLKEKYEPDRYTFTVDGVYDYSGALAVFMPRAALNETFDLGSDYYGGYFSDAPLSDIDEKYIGSVIDLDALTKVSRQLTVSMGSMMGLVNGFAIMIFAVVVYLLSKMMIEKNAQSISMAKILGYSGAEIARLYLLPTTLVVVLCLAASLPVVVVLMRAIFRVMMMESMSGWIALWVSPTLFPRMMAYGLAAYAVVAALEYRRIRRVPMDEALKNVE